MERIIYAEGSGSGLSTWLDPSFLPDYSPMKAECFVSYSMLMTFTLFIEGWSKKSCYLRKITGMISCITKSGFIYFLFYLLVIFL